MSLEKLIKWWERGVFVALCLSIALLGIGQLESSLSSASASAWSVSRTTFFFWLIAKLLMWFRYGNSQLVFYKLNLPFPVLLFFFFVTISLLPDFHSAGDYRYFFFAAMHYLMIVDIFRDEKRLRLIYLLLALLPGLLVVRGILHDPSVLELEHMRRFGYPLSHPNTAGYLFAMTIPLCLAMAVGEKGKLRQLSLISSVCQLLGLLLTYSRGSWLGWTASMIFFGSISKRRELSALVIVTGLLLFFATPLRDRLFTLVRPQTDSSISERMQAMSAGLELGVEHPVLGVGYGRGRLREGLRDLYGDAGNDIARIAHTHNMYVDLFAETGVLGLGAFLWLLGYGLRQTLANARRVDFANRVFQHGIASSWIAFAVAGLGDVPFFHHDIRILFFTILALIHLHGQVSPFTPSSTGKPMLSN